MAGPIKISFLADVGKAQKNIAALETTTRDAGAGVESSSGGMADGMGKVGMAALGMNAAVDTASAGLQAIDDIQNSARNEAVRLARAQLEVEQAMADGKQAAIDLKQATLDLSQAQLDGRQAAVDVEQAQIDSKQAALDATVAQKEYSAAVKKYGKDSAEARQAEIDLSQARADSKQATVDLKQAQEDAKQAVVDGAQALADSTQAGIDARESVVNLSEAQRSIDPSPIQRMITVFNQLAPALALATLATTSFSLESAKATGAMVIQKATMMAGAVATGVTTAAQWLLNAALTANPIGIVVVAIAALVAGLVLAYQKSATFRLIVNTAFTVVKTAAMNLWTWVKDAWPKLVKTFTDLPTKIKAEFSGANKWLANAGMDIMNGLWDGIKSGWGTVKRFLSDITSQIPVWKGPPSRDRTLLTGSGKLIMDGFRLGLESRYAGVRSSLGGFTDSIGAVGSASASAVSRETSPSMSARTVIVDLGGELGRLIIDAIRKQVGRNGGNVQIALGGTR